MCGGKHDKDVISNLLLNPPTKMFENRPTFGKVMNEEYRWSFLTHSVEIKLAHTLEIDRFLIL